jgi:hypothetical protein
MIERCENPNNVGYKNYGGRGITICARWRNSFETFAADMGPRPDGMTIDRIDNDCNYGPGNCRWATRIQQSTNRRPVINALGVRKYDGKKRPKYRTRIKHAGIEKHIGSFDTLSEAVIARRQAASERHKKVFGDADHLDHGFMLVVDPDVLVRRMIFYNPPTRARAGIGDHRFMLVVVDPDVLVRRMI